MPLEIAVDRGYNRKTGSVEVLADLLAEPECDA